MCLKKIMVNHFEVVIILIFDIFLSQLILTRKVPQLSASDFEKIRLIR